MTKIMLTKSSEPRPRVGLRRGPAHVVGQEGAPAGSSSPTGSTFWKRVRRCPREHALYNYARLRGLTDDEALTVGFLFHHGLEVFYRTVWEHQQQLVASGYDTRDPDPFFLYGANQKAQNAVWEALKPVSMEPGYFEPTGDARIEPTWTVVERCLASYFERWIERDRWRIIAVEETIEFVEPTPHQLVLSRPSGDVVEILQRLTRAYRYSARLDMIVECYDRGGMWAVEHKTARFISRDLLEGYQLDLQILGQAWLITRCVDLSELPPYKGVIVNITSKQKNPMLERVEVCPSEMHLQAFEKSVNGWGVIESVQRELGYPHAFGACNGPDRGYRRCAYFDLCHAYPNASVAALTDGDAPDGFVRLPPELVADVDYEAFDG